MKVDEVESYISKHVEVTFLDGSKSSGYVWRNFSRTYDKSVLLLVPDGQPNGEFRLWPHQILCISELKESE